ncbi:response regulator [Azospirillum sp. ST 5-10]|uniref:response regulator n=1 Tax=unclassified Azospirillum TaxID=2630922 RepID=UPI003F4A4C1D
MTDEHICVLIVDDEQLIALALTLTLREMGLRVCGTAATAAKAVELARMHRPSLVLMDVRLKGQADGVDAALEIRQTLGPSIIFITGSRDPETVKRIHQDHPAGVLFKPIMPNDLKAEIDKALFSRSVDP